MEKVGEIVVLNNWMPKRQGKKKFRRRCNAICYCGNEFETDYHNLKTGRTKSCGCYAREMMSKRMTKHGKRNLREYDIWCSMKSRCHNENSSSYKNYGARGISVCKEWFDDFEKFYSDMGECPQGFSIERIDNNGNYEVANCKWADSFEQASNKRNIIIVKYNGEEIPLFKLAEKFGILPDTLKHRIFKIGLSVEEALSHEKHKTTAEIKRGKDRYNVKLKETDVFTIRNLAGCGMIRKEIADIFKVSVSTIAKVVNRKAWTHLTHPELIIITKD